MTGVARQELSALSQGVLYRPLTREHLFGKFLNEKGRARPKLVSIVAVCNSFTSRACEDIRSHSMDLVNEMHINQETFS